MNALSLNLLSSSAADVWVGTMRDLFVADNEAQIVQEITFYALAFNTGESRNLVINGSQISIARHQVLLLRPCSVFKGNAGHLSDIVVLAFDPSVFRNFEYGERFLDRLKFEKAFLANPYDITDVLINKWSVLMRFMKDDLLAMHENNLFSYLTIFLNDIERFEGFGTKPINDSQGLSKVAAFLKLLEENYKIQKKPLYYATNLNISVSYLNKLCNLHKNASSGKIIKEKVLDECVKCILNTSKSISTISSEYGFTSPAYFIIWFKKWKGLSPEKYRKQCSQSIGLTNKL